MSCFVVVVVWFGIRKGYSKWFVFKELFFILTRSLLQNVNNNNEVQVQVIVLASHFCFSLSSYHTTHFINKSSEMCRRSDFVIVVVIDAKNGTLIKWNKGNPWIGDIFEDVTWCKWLLLLFFTSSTSLKNRRTPLWRRPFSEVLLKRM